MKLPVASFIRGRGHRERMRGVSILQEEVENRTVNLAVTTTRLTARTILSAVRKYLDSQKRRKMEKSVEKPVGKQSVQELIGQNQGASSIDIAKTDLKGFERYARRFGVDYAITKDHSGKIPKYTCFFKARDSDVLTAAFNAYSAEALRKQERPSVLKQLEKLKALVARLPVKVKTKEKERTEGR